MGTFPVAVEIGDSRGERWATIEALVDTGATYMVIPASTLEALGIVPHDRRPFVLANEQQIELEVGHIWVRAEDRSAIVLAAFGDGERPLPGAAALESLGLAVDPVRRRLVPVPGLLI